MGEHVIALERLSRKKQRLSFILSACVCLLYFSFILIAAFFHEIAALKVMEGVSLVMLLGFLTIVVVWATILAYIHWANNYYDEAVDRIKKIFEQKGGHP